MNNEKNYTMYTEKQLLQGKINTKVEQINQISFSLKGDISTELRDIFIDDLKNAEKSLSELRTEYSNKF